MRGLRRVGEGVGKYVGAPRDWCVVAFRSRVQWYSDGLIWMERGVELKASIGGTSTSVSAG